MLGSAATADECIPLKNTTGGGGVENSLPEMQKEANLGGKKEGSQDACACCSEVRWGQLTLPLATCRSTPGKANTRPEACPSIVYFYLICVFMCWGF